MCILEQAIRLTTVRKLIIRQIQYFKETSSRFQDLAKEVSETFQKEPMLHILRRLYCHVNFLPDNQRNRKFCFFSYKDSCVDSF